MRIKKLLTLSLAFLMMIGMLTACSSSKPSEEPTPAADEKVAVTVTVWSPQEDQSEENGKWLQTMCDNFAAAHPEWEITFNYGVCSEGDAKTNVTTDPAAAADVYMYANDQIPDLLKAGAIAELGGSTLDTIKKNNSATTVNTVTYDGAVYGAPYSGNTWFMFYDKSVFTEDDVKSLDAMLEKGKVAFPLNNSWYIAAFYVANGCTLFGPDGGDAAAEHRQQGRFPHRTHLLRCPHHHEGKGAAPHHRRAFPDGHDLGHDARRRSQPRRSPLVLLARLPFLHRRLHPRRGGKEHAAATCNGEGCRWCCASPTPGCCSCVASFWCRASPTSWCRACAASFWCCASPTSWCRSASSFCDFVSPTPTSVEPLIINRHGYNQ